MIFNINVITAKCYYIVITKIKYIYKTYTKSIILNFIARIYYNTILPLLTYYKLRVITTNYKNNKTIGSYPICLGSAKRVIIRMIELSSCILNN